MFCLGHEPMSEGRAFEIPLPYYPVAEGANRACVGRNRAHRAMGRGGGRRGSQEDHPATDLGLGERIQSEEMALSPQILLEQPQGRLVPFYRFGTASGGQQSLDVGLDGQIHRHLRQGDGTRSFSGGWATRGVEWLVWWLTGQWRAVFASCGWRTRPPL